jgi:ADP-heptose:LPS heptosyltransferase
MRLDTESILALDASPFGRSLDLVPSINLVRAAHPGSHIAVAASTGICELLTSLRLVDKAISLGVIKPSHKGLGSGVFRIIRLSRSFGGDEVDLVLDFSPGVATLLFGLTRRAKIITPVVNRRKRKGDAHIGTNAGRGGRAAYESILDQLDLSTNISTWSHVPAPFESSRFEQSLSRSGFKGGEPLLLLYTAEVGWSRSWPIHRYTELALRLHNSYGVRVIVADVPYSSDFTGSIGALLPKEAVKLRAPRAGELVAAVARSSLVVTDDSGVAQMAGSLGTPVIDVGFPQGGVRQHGSSGREIEVVYQQACHLLQTSRTGGLFRG